MSATAIIVSFVMGTTDAVFCTAPVPIEQAQVQLAQVPNGSDWSRAHPGLTPPSIITEGHPNYAPALAGKNDGVHSVPPCVPFP